MERHIYTFSGANLVVFGNRYPFGYKNWLFFEIVPYRVLIWVYKVRFGFVEGLFLKVANSPPLKINPSSRDIRGRFQNGINHFQSIAQRELSS
jgi:hypothetical protein